MGEVSGGHTDTVSILLFQRVEFPVRVMVRVSMEKIT